MHFDLGTTTGYGSSSPSQLSAPAAAAASTIGATLTGLPAGTVIHYRAVAATDFGTVDRPDETLTTLPATAPPTGSGAVLAAGTASVARGIAAVKLACHGAGGQRCDGRVQLTVRVRRLTGPSRHRRIDSTTLSLGSAGLDIVAGTRATIDVRLDRRGDALLAAARDHRLRVTVRIALNDNVPTVTGTVQLIPARTRHHRRQRSR